MASTDCLCFSSQGNQNGHVPKCHLNRSGIAPTKGKFTDHVTFGDGHLELNGGSSLAETRTGSCSTANRRSQTQPASEMNGQDAGVADGTKNSVFSNKVVCPPGAVPPKAVHTSPRVNGVSKHTGSRQLKNLPPVVEVDELSVEALNDLFSDRICVLRIKNYASSAVCKTLDAFIRDKALDAYTHEVRTDGRTDLVHYGVNRYGFPLNITYNDETNENLQKYLTQALPTIRSIRKACSPLLSPIDKFRVEMDEVWPGHVNIATLHGQKIFCGIGRLIPADLSALSDIFPHFDAVPTSCFPDIYKQFTANIYLNVPEHGGELEIWDLSPIDIENVENFTIPENWRDMLPESIKIKPESGDLFLFNTRRPHAITRFEGSEPRTSIQTFIGLTKESDVFFWV